MLTGGGIDDAKLRAAVDLVERTGARSFGLRYQDDEPPTVWIALAEYARDGKTIWATGSAIDPLRAVVSLLERLIDGGTCTHCGRPTAIAHTPDEDETFAAAALCWYQFDPELDVYRRACEGETHGDDAGPSR